MRARAQATAHGRSQPSRPAAAFLLGALALLAFSPQASAAEPVKAEATLSAGGGYARLVIKFAEDVSSEVVTAGSIIVIRFERPVDVVVDKVADAVPDYIGSARRDPDGSAIRLSLSRKVTINTMTAGERLYVDLLPDSWNGPPPSLPQDVVRELAERARAAERELRQQRAMSEAKKRPPVRVRASVQPTFVRFIFEMPDGVGVSSVLNEQKLKLLFSKALTFDLADAKISAPPNVSSISQKIEGETAVVELIMLGDVDVHSFREDKNYVIDVAFQQPDKAAVLPQAADAAHGPPPRVSEKPAPAMVAAPAPAAPVPAAAMTPAAPVPAAPVAATPATTMPAEKPVVSQKPLAPEKPVMAEKPVTMEKMAPAPQPQPSEPHAAATPAASTAPTAPAVAEAAVESAPKTAASEAVPPAAPPGDMPAATEVPAKKPITAPAMAAPAMAAAAEAKPEAASNVSVLRDGAGLHLTFSLPAGTPAALFRRADTLWLMLDSKKPIDVESIRGQGGAAVADVSVMPQERGQAVRFRLNRPQLPSLSGEDLATGTNWTVTFADAVQTPSQALSAIRNIADPSLANVTVPLPGAGMLHRFTDPDAGDTLFVVTARAPARGFIKRQDFVELSLLESIHGVAIRPNSDEVTADVGPDKVILGKPGGLTLSPADSGAERAPTAVRPIFDLGEWRKNQEGIFNERADALIEAAGAAASGGAEARTAAQLDLARFYMARAMFPEAVGVLNLELSDEKQGSGRPVRPDRSCAGQHPDGPSRAGTEGSRQSRRSAAITTSQLWKAMASARQGKWADAREKFKNSEFSVTSLPIDLQRIVIADALRASDRGQGLSGRGQARQRTGSDRDRCRSMLRRLPCCVAGSRRALVTKRMRWMNTSAPTASPDRPAATEAELLLIALKQKRDEISQEDVLKELETLAITWRGDALEVQALEMLARIYADSGPLCRTPSARCVPPIFWRQIWRSPARARMRRRRFCPALSRPQRRRPSADRRARNVLRISRPDADRPARRRNDPPARRSPGCGRSARPGRRAPAIPGRQAARRRRARASRGPPCRWSTLRTTSRSVRSTRFAPPGLPTFPANCGSNACCSRRARRATSGVTTSRSTSFPTSMAAKRSGCAPTSIGPRGNGASRPSRSNSITPTAGAISNR